MTIRTLLLLPLFCLFTGTVAYAQFGSHHYYNSYNHLDDNGKKMAQRMYFGFSFPMMGLDLTQKYQIDRSTTLGYNAGPSVDTTIHLSKNSPTTFGIKNVFGMVGGVCFKLVQTSETSMIALDVSASLELYTWNIGKVKYSKIDSATDDVFCVQARVPLALLYKTGPEVTLNGAQKVLFSIGGGIAPTIAESSYESTDGGFFKFKPFLTTEIGAYFGMALKLKAVYYPGTVDFFEITGNDLPGYTTNGNLTVSGNGTGNFVFSLVLLFNSHVWQSDGY